MTQSIAVVSFCVVSMTSQELRITEEDLNPQALVTGLNEGVYFTTLDNPNKDMGGEGQSVVRFDDTGNEVKVAEILSTTFDKNSKLEMFTLVRVDESEEDEEDN